MFNAKDRNLWQSISTSKPVEAIKSGWNSLKSWFGKKDERQEIKSIEDITDIIKTYSKLIITNNERNLSNEINNNNKGKEESNNKNNNDDLYNSDIGSINNNNDNNINLENESELNNINSNFLN